MIDLASGYRDPERVRRQDRQSGRNRLFILLRASDGMWVTSREAGARPHAGYRCRRKKAANLQTFPDFGSIAAVPTHGISVGIDTIASVKEAVMIVGGAGKRLTLQRILAAERFDRKWPATVIHECAVREILADAEASTTPGA